jgi:hypothetical protein
VKRTLGFDSNTEARTHEFKSFTPISLLSTATTSELDNRNPSVNNLKEQKSSQPSPVVGERLRKRKRNP